VDELARVVQTVELLRQTVEAMTLRGEQLFKMQDEVLQLSRAAITDMKNEVHNATLELTATREAGDLSVEALRGVLSDLDATTDDLAKVTQALLQVQKQLNPSASNQTVTTAR
jgi:hypothetical protein